MSDGKYREQIPDSDLLGLVQCTWTRTVGNLESQHEVRVVPDGCMDLIWMRGELLVAGPDTQAWLRRLPAGTSITGLRFPPGVAPAILRLQANELLNQRYAAHDCSGTWAAGVADRLENEPASGHVILQDAVRSLLREAEDQQPDPAVRHVVETIVRSRLGSELRAAQLAEQCGLSERQLHRRCSAALGYGVKTYSRIVRFQRFLAMAGNATTDSLAGLAADAGYADQAHLTRDVRAMTGVTPAVLLSGAA
jgi:AraC-like DNA-binding protein